jgi:hypothetical protein
MRKFEQSSGVDGGTFMNSTGQEGFFPNVEEFDLLVINL